MIVIMDNPLYLPFRFLGGKRVGLPLSPEGLLPGPRPGGCLLLCTLQAFTTRVSLDCQPIQGQDHHPQNIGKKSVGISIFPGLSAR